MRKITGFLKEAYAELRKVVWPSRSRAARLTVIVIAVTLVVGAFLAAVDFGLGKGIQYVIDSTQDQGQDAQIPAGSDAQQIPGGPGQIPGAQTGQQPPPPANQPQPGQ